MIDKETIDKIFDAADIVDVVSDFVHLKKRGVNYIGNCPFHNEKTASFTVSPAKGIYKCFGCGKGGNSVNFIMEHEQLSYVETLKYLAKRYHIEVVEQEVTDQEKEKNDARESMLVVNSYAQKTFTHNLTETEEGRAVGLKYFKERGFTEVTIKKFELGYCRSERDSFTKLAEQKGYATKYLTETGLSIERENGTRFDRFSERVMFPIHNLMGKVIGFGGRTLRTDKKIAKYLNSPESAIYHKSKVLYGLYFAKKSITHNDKCYMVEGYTDVMSMHQAGIENVVASSGTALTPDQIRLIKRFTPNITVLYDGDAAGIKAALRGIDLVLEEGMNVKVVLLPDGEDPDSFAHKHSATEFYDFINKNETDFITFKTKLLLSDTQNDPVKKANLIQDIVRTIAVIPDGITRSVYVKECSSLMSVDEKILYTEINKIIYKNREKNWNFRPEPEIQYFEPERVTETVIPSSTKFEQFEREILRLLLSYGSNVLFTIENEDIKEEITTAKYICREIEGEIDLQNPIYKLIFNEYAAMLTANQKPDENYFVKHENQMVSHAAADLLATNHQISKMWSKKGTYVNTEEDNLKLVVDNAINGYKYEIIMSLLKGVEEEIKKVQQLDNQQEKLEELYRKYMAYTQFKIEIAKTLGDRIILKR